MSSKCTSCGQESHSEINGIHIWWPVDDDLPLHALSSEIKCIGMAFALLQGTNQYKTVDIGEDKYILTTENANKTMELQQQVERPIVEQAIEAAEPKRHRTMTELRDSLLCTQVQGKYTIHIHTFLGV